MATGGSRSSYISMLSGANRTQYIENVEHFSGKRFSVDIDPYQIKDWIDE